MKHNPNEYARYKWIKVHRGFYNLERISSGEVVGHATAGHRDSWLWIGVGGRYGVEPTRDDCKPKIIECEQFYKASRLDPVSPVRSRQRTHSTTAARRDDRNGPQSKQDNPTTSAGRGN